MQSAIIMSLVPQIPCSSFFNDPRLILKALRPPWQAQIEEKKWRRRVREAYDREGSLWVYRMVLCYYLLKWFPLAFILKKLEQPAGQKTQDKCLTPIGPYVTNPRVPLATPTRCHMSQTLKLKFSNFYPELCYTSSVINISLFFLNEFLIVPKLIFFPKRYLLALLKSGIIIVFN